MKTELELVDESATQVDNYRRCHRYWGFDKISKIPRAENLSLELGKRVHDILENFLQGKERINPKETWRMKPGATLFYPGKIAMGMLSKALPSHYYDRFKAEMEFKMEIGVGNGVLWRGKIDVHWLDEEFLFFVDHKTSKDPAMWGKKEADLLTDTQAILYPRIGFELYPEAEVCSFALNYGSTKLQYNKNYHPTVVSTKEEIIERYERLIVPASQEMAQAFREKINPMELEPNPKACDAYGGCPFRGTHCVLNKGQKMGMFMKSGGLLGKLLDKNNETETAEEVDGLNPPETEEAANTPVLDKKTKLAAMLKSKESKSEPLKTVAKTPAKKPSAGSMLGKLKTAKAPTARKAEEEVAVPVTFGTKSGLGTAEVDKLALISVIAMLISQPLSDKAREEAEKFGKVLVPEQFL